MIVKEKFGSITLVFVGNSNITVFSGIEGCE
jgi:hypothetical protein